MPGWTSHCNATATHIAPVRTQHAPVTGTSTYAQKSWSGHPGCDLAPLTTSFGTGFAGAPAHGNGGLKTPHRAARANYHVPLCSVLAEVDVRTRRLQEVRQRVQLRSTTVCAWCGYEGCVGCTVFGPHCLYRDESFSLPTGCAGHCASLFHMVDAVPAGVPMAFSAPTKSILFPLLRNSNRYVAYASPFLVDWRSVDTSGLGVWSGTETALVRVTISCARMTRTNQEVLSSMFGDLK